MPSLTVLPVLKITPQLRIRKKIINETHVWVKQIVLLLRSIILPTLASLVFEIYVKR
jgi:hypothetical protein